MGEETLVEALLDKAGPIKLRLHTFVDLIDDLGQLEDIQFARDIIQQDP